MLNPQWILILAAVLWGSSWLPLHAFAAQGIDGFPMVLASYGMIALVAVPLMLWQKALWWPQRWGVFGIALFGGWSNAALLSSPVDLGPLVTLSRDDPDAILQELGLLNKLVDKVLNADEAKASGKRMAKTTRLEALLILANCCRSDDESDAQHNQRHREALHQ